jgi:hypothetical protein
MKEITVTEYTGNIHYSITDGHFILGWPEHNLWFAEEQELGSYKEDAYQFTTRKEAELCYANNIEALIKIYKKILQSSLRTKVTIFENEYNTLLTPASIMQVRHDYSRIALIE